MAGLDDRRQPGGPSRSVLTSLRTRSAAALARMPRRTDKRCSPANIASHFLYNRQPRRGARVVEWA